MIKTAFLNLMLFCFWLLINSCTPTTRSDQVKFIQEQIFPLVKDHVHGSTIAELPNGNLLAAWFQGSGERWADDVRIMGPQRWRKYLRTRRRPA